MKKTTKFSELPNEIIYNIFNYLKENEIIYSFIHLNNRYENLVRNHIKKLDLTVNCCEIKYEQLKWIWNSIEQLKIDSNSLYLFNSSIKHRKSLFHSMKQFIFCSKQTNSSEINLNFNKIKSFELFNMRNWSIFLNDKYSCENLSIWFDGSIEYFNEIHLIPLTIKSFSTNSILNSHNFHSNLIELNLTILSMIKLIEILNKTPRIKILSVKFANNFTCLNSIEFEQIQKLISKFHRLNCLSKLSFASKINEINKYFPFEQIDLFIIHCCPNSTILNKISFKFDYISFHWNIYYRLIEYQNQFKQFHIYISFEIESNLLNNFIEKLNFDERFNYHIENSFIHIYTKPFVFDSFHGFVNCNELNSNLIYRTVRHLYFTRFRLYRCLSFENLSKQMPNLISIDCDITFDIHFHNKLSQILIEKTSFPTIRSFRFLTHCLNENCICQNYLSQLLKQMPNLQILISSQINYLLNEKNQFIKLEQLNLRQCYFQINSQLISKIFPNLKQLLLGYLFTNSNELFQFIRTIFIEISTLKLISFRLNFKNNNDQIRAQQIFNRLKQNHKYFRHLQLNFSNGKVNFSLEKF